MTCLRSRVPRKAASPASTPRPGRRLAAGRGHVLRPSPFLLSSLQKTLKSPPTLIHRPNMGAIAPNLKAAAAEVRQMGLGDRRRLQTHTSLAGILQGLPTMRAVT